MEQNLRDTLKSAVNQVDNTYLKIGEMLSEVLVGRLWQTWGFGTFPQYVEKELGFKYRKAMYLVEIYRRYIVELNLKEADLSGLSYSKLGIMLPVLSRENHKDLLQRARKLSVSELRRSVGLKSGGVGPKGFTFYLYPEQEKNVTSAVDLAMKIASTDSRGHALDMMALEFNSRRVSSTEKDILQNSMQELERLFHVKLVAFTDMSVALGWAKKLIEESETKGA